MIQALYQALQISVSWERVSEIQSIKETAPLTLSEQPVYQDSSRFFSQQFSQL